MESPNNTLKNTVIFCASFVIFLLLDLRFQPFSPFNYKSLDCIDSEGTNTGIKSNDFSNEDTFQECPMSPTGFSVPWYTMNMKEAERVRAAPVWKPCNFTRVEEGGPIPVILVVLGRSGSTITYSTMTRLAGYNNRIWFGEDIGKNGVSVLSFLKSMTLEETTNWASRRLCEISKVSCKAPFAGFKWKPARESWELPAAQAMLKEIASHNDPPIRVVVVHRNHLDVLISRTKHHLANKNDGIEAPSHCRTEDEDCFKEHLEVMKDGVHLSAVNILQQLRDNKKLFETINSDLNRLHVKHIFVTYEKLYNSNNAEEWMKIFKFLGRGPTENLTMTEVQESFDYVATHEQNTNYTKLIKNYDAVYQALKDTEFEIP